MTTTSTTAETVTLPNRRAPIYALLTANAISQVGNMMTAVAIPWFVLQTTHSAAQTGLSAFASTLPIFFSGLIGGVIVDRVGAKRMSIIADLLSMITVALVPILYSAGVLSYPLLLALVVAGTILDTPGSTARQTMMPDLAKQAGMKLERANAAYGSIFRFSILLGPPLAGLLIGFFGTANVLWIDAATFLISALLIGLLTPHPQRQPKPTGGSHPLTEMLDGLRFFGRERLLLALLILFAVVDLLANAVVLVVLPVYASSLYGTAESYGLMLGVFGGGTLVGTLLYGVRGHKWSRRGLVILAIIGFGLPLWVLAALPTFAIALVMSFIMGLVIGPVGPMIMTLYHERVPAEMRGRVFGTRAALDTLSIPFAALLTGIIVQGIGLQITLVGFAIAFLIVTTAAALAPIFKRMEDQPADATVPETQ
jgi:MFS family permease